MFFECGERVEMKKGHPCGSKQWEILRVGADFRLKCLGCGHQVMIPRSKFEKSVVKRLGKPGSPENLGNN